MRNIYCYRQKNLFYEQIKVVYDFHCFTVHFFSSLNNKHQPMHFTLNTILV